MFIVTNRRVDESAKRLKKLGCEPNIGRNLRLVEATRGTDGWKIKILPDKISDSMKKEVALTGKETVYASKYVARKLIKNIRKKKRNLLFFVHGFNNDVKAVLDRADKFAKKYKVEVLAFTWPANGGGAKGVLDYKSDKADARVSGSALEHCFKKMDEYLRGFNAELVNKIIDKANKRFPDNAEKRDEYITTEMEKGCPFTVNMVLHSMGNYVLKQSLKSTLSSATRLIFDNIILAAADTNNLGHEQWVDNLKCRKRVYITINENDSALEASRLKAGDEQYARLGHYPYNLYSNQAVYVDFTNASYVGKSHAYFEGKALKNKNVIQFFQKAFNGQVAEKGLKFDPDTRTYEI